MTNPTISKRFQYNDPNVLTQLYNLQIGFVMRRKIHFCFAMFSLSDEMNMTFETFHSSIKKIVRQTDFVFGDLEKTHVLVLLPSCKSKEVHFLRRRIEENLKLYNGELKTCISEIASSKVKLEEVLSNMFLKLEEIKVGGVDYIELDLYKKRDYEHIKVSIIENEYITASIIHNIFLNLDVDNVLLDIQLFNDGIEFVESDWYKSSHHHIVVINDILPRMNGIEVCEFLRKLPNEQKFFIYFISNRLSEDAAIYAYEKGADFFLTRPINLNIVEMHFKNYIRRIV